MDIKPLQVLVEGDKCKDTVTGTAMQQLEEEVLSLQKQRDQLHQEAADHKKSDKSHVCDLQQHDRTISLMSDQNKWQERMSLLRQELAAETALNEKIRASARHTCGENSRILNEESSALQDITIHNQELDDEDMENNEDDDVTDAADSH